MAKSLYDKIMVLCPNLTPADFMPGGTIVLQNDENGLGDYIKSWNNTVYTQPTAAQLNAIT